MKIEKVKVRAIDDVAGRVAEISTDKLKFQTPSRGATSTEYNYKKTLKLAEPFDNKVGEYVGRFNAEDIKRFRAKNGSYSNRLKQAAFYGSAMIFAVSKTFPQHPKNYAFDEDTIRLLVELQIEAGLDVATIPFAPMSAGNLLKYYARWTKHCEDYGERQGRETVAAPEVPMYLDEEPFQRVMEGLWDSRAAYPLVALTYAPIREYKINYDFLRKEREQETWLHISQVPRVPPGASRERRSAMHLPQIYGIDTVTTAIPWGGGTPKADFDFAALRYFDRPTLSVPRISEWRTEHGSENPNCSCPACQGRGFQEIAEAAQGSAEEADGLSALFGAFRLHEVFESGLAFDEGRVYITENGFQDYLAERLGQGVSEFTG